MSVLACGGGAAGPSASGGISGGGGTGGAASGGATGGGGPASGSGGTTTTGTGGGTGTGGSAPGGPATGGTTVTGSGGTAAGAGGAGRGGRGGAGGAPRGTGGTTTPTGGGMGTAGLGGDSKCGGGQYAICESFEGTAVGGVPTGWTAHGAAAVAMDQAARGTHSLKVSPAARGERRIYASATALGSGHWGRIFYKFQAPVPVSCDPANSVLHGTFVGLHGVGPRNGAEEVRVVDAVQNSAGMHQWIYNLQLDGAGEFGKGTDYLYKFDGNWHCAEWHIDNPTQNYHLFIDGAEIPGVAVNNGAGNFTNTDVPPVFDQVRIGMYNYQMACTPYLTLWIDEIAMDPMRIGCGN